MMDLDGLEKAANEVRKVQTLENAGAFATFAFGDDQDTRMTVMQAMLAVTEFFIKAQSDTKMKDYFREPWIMMAKCESCQKFTASLCPDSERVKYSRGMPLGICHHCKAPVSYKWWRLAQDTVNKLLGGPVAVDQSGSTVAPTPVSATPPAAKPWWKFWK